MAINSIGQSNYAVGLQQKQQSINNLYAALKSGDIVAAQKAYAASGIPPLAANNNSPLGRLYNALKNEDLKLAQQAALDMQGHNRASFANTFSNVPNSSSSANSKVDLKVAALDFVKHSKQQSKLSSLLALGNNINIQG